MRSRAGLLPILCILSLVVGLVAPTNVQQAQAQNDVVTITIAVPSSDADIYNDTLLGAFEQAYPNIKVKVVKTDSFIPRPSDDITSYFTALETYASSADVLTVDSRRTSITPEATRAGYFLDLSPLAKDDANLNISDFYTPLWESYQWDNGIWMLPTAADFVVMSYDKAAFDTAGLTYPSEKWGMSDLIDAATKLTQKDASGAVTTAGIGISDMVYPSLFRSLLSGPLYDSSTIPNPPKIDTEETENLLNTWYQLEEEGAITNSFSVSGLPLSIALLSQSMRVGQSDTNRGTVLLPGGKAGLNLSGFAVSSGTRYPEQAYTFASFLTTRTEVSGRSMLAARKSLASTASSGGGPGGGGPGGGGPGGAPGGAPGAAPNASATDPATTERQALIALAAENAIPISETRFADNLEIALRQMRDNSLDGKSALQAVEATLASNLQAATDKKSSLAVTVATPVPDPTLSAGQVEIKFGVTSFTTPLANEDKWKAVISDFLAANPDIGAVTLDTVSNGGLGELATLTTKYDCFALSSNIVQSADLGSLLNMDPFLTADTSFSKDDVVNGVLSQLQRDNKTYGLPLYLQPDILRYDTLQFNKYNVPLPSGAWTIQAFADAIKALKVDPDSSAPFSAENTFGTHLLILIAAYGGIPLDYSTNPVTIDFTSQQSVDAIRQVLDLVKGGYIEYSSLSGTGGFAMGPRGGSNTPIYTDSLNGFSRQRGPRPGSTDVITTDYQPTTYPTGTEHAAASYSIGTGYISAKTANPEACYRWLSTVSKHSELFSTMPARASFITDPALATAQGADLAALYKNTLDVLQSPTTVIFPSMGGGAASGFLYQMWLYRAFDSYVESDGDLEAALKDSETIAQAFEVCVAALPAYDPATQNLGDHNQQYMQCATKADPNMAGAFN